MVGIWSVFLFGVHVTFRVGFMGAVIMIVGEAAGNFVETGGNVAEIWFGTMGVQPIRA